MSFENKVSVNDIRSESVEPAHEDKEIWRE